MVSAQTRNCAGKWKKQSSLRFRDKTDPQIVARTPDLILTNKKEKNLKQTSPFP